MAIAPLGIRSYNQKLKIDDNKKWSASADQGHGISFPDVQTCMNRPATPRIIRKRIM